MSLGEGFKDHLVRGLGIHVDQNAAFVRQLFFDIDERIAQLALVHVGAVILQPDRSSGDQQFPASTGVLHMDADKGLRRRPGGNLSRRSVQPLQRCGGDESVLPLYEIRFDHVFVLHEGPAFPALIIWAGRGECKRLTGFI